MPSGSGDVDSPCAGASMRRGIHLRLSVMASRRTLFRATKCVTATDGRPADATISSREGARGLALSAPDVRLPCFGLWIKNGKSRSEQMSVGLMPKRSMLGAGGGSDATSSMRRVPQSMTRRVGADPKRAALPDDVTTSSAMPYASTSRARDDRRDARCSASTAVRVWLTTFGAARVRDCGRAQTNSAWCSRRTCGYTARAA